MGENWSKDVDASEIFYVLAPTAEQEAAPISRKDAAAGAQGFSFPTTSLLLAQE